MWYNAIRPILFALDAEFTHNAAIALLKRAPIIKKAPSNEHAVQVFGLTFPNPIGLAAGLDKNAECLNAWEAMGFGFIEVGTVTPKPQYGNTKPRLFRLPKSHALINRLGFNNKGVDYLIEQLVNHTRHCPIGVNIGKNRDTDLNNAAQDYSICFEKVYPYADYVTVNLSSPNTPGLRQLQEGEMLDSIMQPLKALQQQLADKYTKYVPILVKIAPDLEEEALHSIIDGLLRLKVDGVIATNTTLSRSGLQRDDSMQVEVGGLSGKPLFDRSTAIVEKIAQQAGDALPIIAVGGIMHPKQVQEKFKAGAKLVQLYTGLIYRGPRLIQDILKNL